MYVNVDIEMQDIADCLEGGEVETLMGLMSIENRARARKCLVESSTSRFIEKFETLSQMKKEIIIKIIVLLDMDNIPE
jgi:hypothetical protein|tara:strand:+ start:37 stop:270 length:234 start_codon:yes stop_codon:yes gene_type:complete